VTSCTEIVSRFGTSRERLAILRGLLDYRATLSTVGIVRGFQWIDGSFVEDCETIRRRPPDDVDIVTFAYRPPFLDWPEFVRQHPQIFDPFQTKASFRCHAYYVDLQTAPHLIVHDTTYFSSLFSHQRDSKLWKGMLTLDLNSDDVVARLIL
jgi:phage terminase large subunit